MASTTTVLRTLTVQAHERERQAQRGKARRASPPNPKLTGWGKNRRARILQQQLAGSHVPPADRSGSLLDDEFAE